MDEEDGSTEQNTSSAIDASWINYVLDTIWEAIILNDSQWNPERSCYDLADEYRKTGRNIDKCVGNFIDWQIAKAAGTGFVLGLPGFVFGLVTIPADLTCTVYLQLRMVAVIAILYGWDAKSDRLKTLALLSMLGTGAMEILREAGINIGSKLAASLLRQIPGHILISASSSCWPIGAARPTMQIEHSCDHAAAATPVNSAQVRRAWARAARY